jgi:hypothetical protein
MAKLMISTQVFENYAWGEDGTLGTGENAYWKAKGGSEYFVRDIDVNRAAEIAAWAAEQVKSDNDFFRESMIDWCVVEDDYLTQFERDQIRFEGKITHPAPELVLL